MPALELAMYYDDEEDRDPFDAFGTPDATPEPANVDADAQPKRVIAPEPPKAKPIRSGFSLAGFCGGLAALAWIAGAIGGPLSYFGADALRNMEPLVQVGLIALALGPGLLFWVSASAAGEALKARKLAHALTRMAQDARMPFLTSEGDAQRMARRVQGEIESLTVAVNAALDRLDQLEQSAKRNAALFGEAVSATRETAESMAVALKREREAVIAFNGELKQQTDDMAQSIGRQIRLLRETSKLVRNEVESAERVLSASTNEVSDRTAAMQDAAEDAANASATLNGTLAQMLDGLSEATRLTETARRSTEQAVSAAKDTAGAVREGTRVAIFEAKRAADFVRAETVALQDNAGDVIAKLREAAQTARSASQESRAAHEREASVIEERIGALADAGEAKVASGRGRRVALEPTRTKQPVTRSRTTRGDGAQPRVRNRRDPQDAAQQRASGSFASWSTFNASRAVPPRPANEDSGFDDDFGYIIERNDPDLALKNGVFDLLICAGVDLGNVLKANDLDGIARRSRAGVASRRGAVADAAPNAVSRIARYVARDIGAQALAVEFRARPDLATKDDDGDADLVRAYLLIDAALS
jgi:hypothetical protein